ncbi:MAG: Na+/H+ antiporter NhaC family protein [Myxococcota bacterium]|nr:Na+/H+ antiporter NhaC family protein [Myxococcota bacterium]
MRIVIILWLALCATVSEAGSPPVEFRAEWPNVRLWAGAEKVDGVKIKAFLENGQLAKDFSGAVKIDGLGLTSSVAAKAGVIELDRVNIERETITVQHAAKSYKLVVPTLDGIWSLLPAIIAIGLALISRQVLLSLLGGIFIGAWLLFGSPISAVPRTLDILTHVAADADRVKIMIFTLLMGGMVGIISRSGGTAGIVDMVVRYAKGVKSASFATWLMGMLVFFDDYASSLLVGSTMRPVTDKFRISREKLSYLVDSTAAPIASLALISTWVGYEVSLLADAMRAAGIERDAYDVFINGVPSRFYQFFALIFVVFIATTGRDFGPMLRAERRARKEGKPIRDGGEPLMDTGLMEEADEMSSVTPRWWLALIPITTLVLTVLVHLWTTGHAAGLSDLVNYEAAKQEGLVRWFGYILSNAASYDALLYASAFGAGSAALLALATGSMTLKTTTDALVRGVRAMTLAIMVLILAWSIGKVMDDLRAGNYVASVLAETLPAWTIPTLTFILAGLIALATGTSWGTMAILFPIVIPLVATHQGLPEFEAILLGASSAILGGSVFGDHCSPISDTTVLSSIACASDHVDHVNTQAPYSLACAAAAIFVGYIPLGFGFSPWLSLAIGLGLLFALVRFAGREIEN